MLYSLGYEGRDLDEVVRLLLEHRVEVLVDVRGSARSRKPGFNRSRLAAGLEDAGIGYRHEPDLGVPAAERDAFRAGTPETVAAYRRRLEADAREAVDRVATLAAAGGAALLCFERDEGRCHRRLVAEAVRRLAPEIDHVPVE